MNGKSDVYDVTVFPMESGTLTSSRLQRISNTMAARLLAYLPRTAAENATVNWASVVSYASKGISDPGGFDVSPIGDGCTVWCSLFQFYGDEPTWLRVDMRLINVMDPNSPAKFTGTIPPRGFVTGRALRERLPVSWSRYRRSGPRDLHAEPVLAQALALPRPHCGPSARVRPLLFLKAENDLLWAEGLIRTNGNLGHGGDAHQQPRVGRGQLPPADRSRWSGRAARLAVLRAAGRAVQHEWCRAL